MQDLQKKLKEIQRDLQEAINLLSVDGKNTKHIVKGILITIVSKIEEKEKLC